MNQHETKVGTVADIRNLPLSDHGREEYDRIFKKKKEEVMSNDTQNTCPVCDSTDVYETLDKLSLECGECYTKLSKKNFNALTEKIQKLKEITNE